MADATGTARDFPRRLRKLDEDGEDAFLVLFHDAVRHDPARPLVVIVHPGDMIEVRQGWSRDDWPGVLGRSLSCQAHTALELERWRKRGADFVILHRASCSQIAKGERPTCDDHFASEIVAARKAGTVLYGDDLDAAGQWMLDHLHIEQRPAIYMAGAYADADHGCLTAIGQMLESVARGRITVSEHAVAKGDRWVPQVSSPKGLGL